MPNRTGSVRRTPRLPAGVKPSLRWKEAKLLTTQSRRFSWRNSPSGFESRNDRDSSDPPGSDCMEESTGCHDGIRAFSVAVVSYRDPMKNEKILAPDVPLGVAAPLSAGATVFSVILAISFCHLLNDMMQILLPSIYPNLASGLRLTFGQVGAITMVYQVTASLLQPLVGLQADRRPAPFALPVGTIFSLAGLVVISMARSYGMVLAGSSLLGMGSSIFHPESSRVARMAAGKRHGMAQSLFQVGGNAGAAIGPLAAALVVVRFGQSSLALFALLALLSFAVSRNIARVSNESPCHRALPSAASPSFWCSFSRNTSI